MKFISMLCYIIGFVAVILGIFTDPYYAFAGIALGVIGLVIAIIIKNRKKAHDQKISGFDRYNIKNNIVIICISILIVILGYFDVFEKLLK